MFAGSRCYRVIENETLFQRESGVGKVWLLAQIEQSDSRTFRGNATNDFVLNVSNCFENLKHMFFISLISLFYQSNGFEIKDKGSHLNEIYLRQKDVVSSLKY